MASKSNLVNLDALIKREDFALQDEENESINQFRQISVHTLTSESLIVPNLRKPDFQRETNHWGPEQVHSFLESFVSGDVVPSIILWQSSSYIYVIDGGHRLSAIRAWIENDYGDGHLSQHHFNYTVDKNQRKNAEKTRLLINSTIGSYKQNVHKNSLPTTTSEDRKKLSRMFSIAIEVQWIKGNSETAERSFFKINTQGTPLDDIEEELLRNRNKPVAIASRAIIRAGTGHEYWSQFPDEIKDQIVEKSKKLHLVLFEPELKTPVKNIDLPLGGSKGVRSALKILMDFISFSNRGKSNTPKQFNEYDDDNDGTATVNVLLNALKVANKLTGNDIGSLGLHPAVYYYGPSGRHVNAMFLGMVSLFSKKIAYGDKDFFKSFTKAREKLETILIDKKLLIADILNKKINKNRIPVFAELISDLVKFINQGMEITDSIILQAARVEGNIYSGINNEKTKKFADDTKSRVFISVALKHAFKCPLCGGYLDTEKSMSYDHIKAASIGGDGSDSNCQLTHPYCNSLKSDLPV